jgi:hypothetical protein
MQNSETLSPARERPCSPNIQNFVLAIDIWLGRMQRNFEPTRKHVQGGCKSQLTDLSSTAIEPSCLDSSKLLLAGPGPYH